MEIPYCQRAHTDSEHNEHKQTRATHIQFLRMKQTLGCQ